MKSGGAFIVTLAALQYFVNPFAPPAGNPLNGLSGTALAEQQAADAQQEREREFKAAAIAAQQQALARIYSKDPWRKMGETTNLARGADWYEFQGSPQEIVSNGVIFTGAWGKPLSLTTSEGRFGTDYGNNLFLVENFPYPVTGGRGFAEMMAYYEGVYDYTTTTGPIITLPKLDYGTPCVKIWSAAEIAAAQQKIEAQKRAVQDRVLKNNQALAYLGDPYGLRRMGERYRDGDGVPKDLAKARDYLMKAVAAGDPSAADELSNLEPSTNAPAGK